MHKNIIFVRSVFLMLAVVVATTIGRTGEFAQEKPLPKVAEAVSDAEVEAMLAAVSNWGRWGDDDQLGTLNLITPEKRRQAAALVLAGVSVSMGHDLIKEPFDDSKPFEHVITVNNREIGGAGDRYSVEYHGFAHTHMDALNHIFWKRKLYNGFDIAPIAAGRGKGSIHVFKHGILTRGVLMDIPALLGVRYLNGDQAIYPAHLEAWENQAGVKVGSGDAVLINTGRWTRREREGPWNIMQNSAGLHVSCLKWLHERDVAIVGSDLALDVMPSGSRKYELPVHLGVVVQLGSCILDCLDFRDIAEECRKQNRWEFMLSVAPLRVEGGTGSPVNPVGTF